MGRGLVTNPVRNRHLVEDLTSACRDLGEGLGDVPKMLRLVLEEEAWREFTTALGEQVVHEHFEEFTRAKPLRGLGIDVDFIRRVIADDEGLLATLDATLQKPAGRPLKTGNNVPGSLEGRPEGNTTEKALRRLRKEADAGNEQAAELRAEVLAGNLTAHAAMVRAGYRPRAVSVPVSRPESVAQTLRKHMKPDDLARLIALLAQEPTDG